MSDRMVILTQVVPQPPQPPPSTLGVSELLSASANYLAQMQATINTLAVVVAAVTVIVGLIGVAFTAIGFLAQRRAQNEISQFRADSAKDIADRHQMHKDEIRLLYEARTSNIEAGLGNLRQELIAIIKESIERVEHMYGEEIVSKLQNIEATYSSNLRRIEDILITFQEECSVYVPGGIRVFDFARYNTFRHLLGPVSS